jgi:hypothetical protein
VVLVGYLVHVAIGEGRSDVSPGLAIRSPSLLVQVPLALPSRLWEVVVVAYARGAAESQPHLGSWASVLGFVYGGVLAGILFALARRGSCRVEPLGRRCAVLFAAVVVGLLPVAAMRGATFAPFSSRFHLTVLPLAVALTTALALVAVRPRFHATLVAGLGLLAGSTAVNHARTAVRAHQRLAAVGDVLRQSTQALPGYTVAVLSRDDLCSSAYGCTAKISARWPVEGSRKFWAFRTTEALEVVGWRASCTDLTELHAGTRGVPREGKVSRVVWIDLRGDVGFAVEPYCLGTGGRAAETGR